MAEETLATSSCLIHEAHADRPEYADAEIFSVSLRERGWARRAGRDELYGKKYNERFVDDLDAMFERGEANKAEKMSPSQTVERLQRMNPGIFRIPAETEVQKYVSSKVKQKKEGKKKKSETKYKMPDEVRAYVKQYAKDKEYNYMPLQAYNATLGHFNSLGPLPDEFSSNTQLSRFAGDVKGKHKTDLERAKKSSLM